MKMTAVQGFEGRREGTYLETVVIVECEDYDAFAVLPKFAEPEAGEVFVKTGWNSDRGEAYYKRKTAAHSKFKAHVCTAGGGE